jgi:MFS family permease
MQSAFLIVAKGYSEKQVGVLFFVFGISQFLFQAPAGYLYDYTEQKVLWLSAAGILTTLMTVVTALFASDDNFILMVLIKFVQGAITSFIPPGLNSITQGIVGSVGMTEQVAVNEMMNHLGTAIIVAVGSLIAFSLYPDIGTLFIVSPIACLGFLYFINQIKSEDIDHDAARGLVAEAGENPKTQEPSDTVHNSDGSPRATTPLQLLRDPILLLFIVICFLFHLSNGTVLPLVMQTLAIGNGQSGILLSGMCITIAQLVMVGSARVCGTYSAKYGRKWLFLIGLGIVPIRCAILGGLLTLKGDNEASLFLQGLILSTQILDGVGAGTFGTMYILVTSDISGGTGRFGLTLGLTTAAMSIGGTVSGYLGQALAQDLGYLNAFWILMVLSLVPTVTYLLFMPETLPAKAQSTHPIAEGGEEGIKSPTGDFVEMV